MLLWDTIPWILTINPKIISMFSVKPYLCGEWQKFIKLQVLKKRCFRMGTFILPFFAIAAGRNLLKKVPSHISFYSLRIILHVIHLLILNPSLSMGHSSFEYLPHRIIISKWKEYVSFICKTVVLRMRTFKPD